MNSERRIQVAIIEDEALIADEIRRTLIGLGYEVSAIYYDYDSAAAAIPQLQTDLFMLDINLGGSVEQGGLALAGIIKATNGKPFIFLTAYSDKDTIAKATALHPANYLIKPVNGPALFAAIQLSLAGMDNKPSAGSAVEDGGMLPAYFYVKLGDRITRLQWQDVYAMKASKNYVLLYATGLPGDYPIRGSINYLLENLVPQPLRPQFFRLGRSLCLNRTHITDATEEYLVCGGATFENAGRLTEVQLAALKETLANTAV